MLFSSPFIPDNLQSDGFPENTVRLPPIFYHMLVKFDPDYCKNCISLMLGKSIGAANDPPLRIGSTCLAMRFAGFSQCLHGFD